MEYKEILLEKAWGHISMDYGLLHLQPQTPLLVMLIIGVMVIALNKLLFQPVLRTLDSRKQVVAESHQSLEQSKVELERLRQSYMDALHKAREQVQETLNHARNEAEDEKEQLLLAVALDTEHQLKLGRKVLHEEIGVVQAELKAMVPELATLTVNRLLS